MNARHLIPLAVFAAIILLSSPVAASLYLTGTSFTPNPPMVPGTVQNAVVTYILLPTGSTTFIRGHELQMQTDLSDAVEYPGHR